MMITASHDNGKASGLHGDGAARRFFRGSASTAAFEELHVAFVFFGRGKRAKRAEVAPFVRLAVDLPGVKAVFAGLELADHGEDLRTRVMIGQDRARIP